MLRSTPAFAGALSGLCAFAVGYYLRRRSKKTQAVRLVQILVCHDDKVLLGRHSSSHLLPGRFTGMIGEARTSESLEDAAKRVLVENCGLHTSGPFETRAILQFVEKDGSEIIEYEMFLQDNGAGLPTKTELMTEIEWYTFPSIPYAQMPADDRIWYPPFLEKARAAPFTGRFTFDGEICVRHHLELR
eukprot:GEMP01051332.1.p1 GENE.GEMP01051332.1~~GEMP01051332.1.p1  ORF type:complete len:188 (+),score=32.02 GEMP01051332.1:159-722(+)